MQVRGFCTAAHASNFYLLFSVGARRTRVMRLQDDEMSYSAGGVDTLCQSLVAMTVLPQNYLGVKRPWITLVRLLLTVIAGVVKTRQVLLAVSNA